MKKKSNLMSGILIGTVLGSMYSLLFAQKKGSTIRKELQETKTKGGNVYEVIAKEFGATSQESVKVMKEMLESDTFQKFLKDTKVKMDELLEVANKKSAKYQDEVRKKLQQLGKMAQDKAEELGETVKEVGMEWVEQSKSEMARAKKKMTKATNKAVNDFKKKVIRK